MGFNSLLFRANFFVLSNKFNFECHTRHLRRSYETMAQTGLLVVTHPFRISRILESARRHVKSILYIQLLPNQKVLYPFKVNDNQFTQPAHLTTYSRLIVNIYSKATAICHDLDVRVLLQGTKNSKLCSVPTKQKIDVVIFDRVFNSDEMDKFVRHQIHNKVEGCKILTLDHDPIQGILNKEKELEENRAVETEPGRKPTDRFYEEVALGGTFDRIHNGHRVLLSEAVLRCTRQLTVGVTDASMLKSKKLCELIAPCLDRMQFVRDYLEDVNPNIHYRIVPIVDPYGPTRDDPNIQMLVVSPETMKGGIKVNEVRAEGGLNPLDIHCIPLMEDPLRTANDEEEKLSSSSYRMRLLGTRLKDPEPRPLLPPFPYVVGLTGGIASGKSSITQHLKELGAGVVSCDQLAHSAYRKGSACHTQLIKEFGEGILNSDGEIDRKKLGIIVFADKKRLNRLNEIVWPEVESLVREECKRLGQEGKQVVCVEAALLLEAGWERSVHEVWVTLIPPKEALQRIMERDGLSEEKAQERLASQLSNAERVSRANVVLSTAWSVDYTQKQVQKAWTGLQHYLKQAKL